MEERTLSNGEGQDDRIVQFNSYLQARGHRESTAGSYLTTAKHFLKWLTKEPIGRTDVSRETVQIFLENHLPVCRCPQSGQRGFKMVRAALNQLLTMEGEGLFRRSGEAESPDIEASIQEFDRYLHEVCGLAKATRGKGLMLGMLGGPWIGIGFKPALFPGRSAAGPGGYPPLAFRRYYAGGS